jgi:ABC-type sugar transport systems, permease components
MRKNRDYKVGDLKKALPFLSLSLAGVSVFVIIPYIDVLRRSFTTITGKKFVGWGNYKVVIRNQAFRLAVFNNIRFIMICIPLLLLLSLLIAVFLYQESGMVTFIKGGLLLPMALPVASVVLFWQLSFHENGFLNAFLAFFNLPTRDWMNSKYSFWILIFSYIWRNLGYQIILWFAGLSMISREIYEAAKVDGANRWQCFIKMTIPNLKFMASTISILAVLNSFKVFREAYLVAGEYPHEDMYLLQHLFNNWFRDLAIDKIAVASVLLSITLFGFIFLFHKVWERNMAI